MGTGVCSEMISAIITCAGNHSRFGQNKLFAHLAGKPVFIRTIEQFQKVKEIDEIIVVVRKKEIKKISNLIQKCRLRAKVVEGGEERYLSAFNGVKMSKGTFILIHDGARPLISPSLIKEIISNVKKHEAVMLAVETTTCIKYIANGYVEKCLPRQNTWLGQTPQAFKREIILKAYEKALKDKNFAGMDDCEFVGKLGIRVKVIPGDYQNLKITVPQDLAIARIFYKIAQKGERNV